MTARKQSPDRARKAALESDFAPLYAVAGLTDAVADAVRQTFAEAQDRAAQRVSQLQGKPAEAEADARFTAEEIAGLIRSLPEITKARLTEAQHQAQELIAGANSTYADLAGRGKRVVDETIGSAKRLSDKAERRTDDLLDDVADAADPAFEKVQETVTVARKKATGRTATDSVTPRGATKAAATRKAATAKAAAEKAPTKKAPAKKASSKKASASDSAQPKPGSDATN